MIDGADAVRRPLGLAAGAVLAAFVATTGVVVGEAAHRASAAAERPDRCDERAVSAEFLDESFADGIDGLEGADYQRAFELDDGRVLWVFQDVFVDDGSGSPQFAHNAGLVQDGTCFDLVGGDDGTAWIELPGGAEFDRWVWPLDGYQVDDDTFRLYVAEMHEQGGAYLTNTTPVATWTVDVDLDDWSTGDLAPAPDPTPSLYGFDITEDDTHRYFYAQCHRQFGFALLGHDACAMDVHVARQPLDAPGAPFEYWDGTAWSADPDAAVDIAPDRPDGESPGHAEPMQFQRTDDGWIAVTKVDDWYGTTVRLDAADRPEGPWTTTAELPVATVDDSAAVSAYFASFVPSDDDGVTVAMSNNRWDGRYSESYRPVVATLPDWLWDTDV